MQSVCGHNDFIHFLFFKQERAEKDDFEINKNFSCKGKILKNFNILKNILKNVQVLTDTFAKTSQNIFEYFFDSEHSKHFVFNYLHYIV